MNFLIGIPKNSLNSLLFLIYISCYSLTTIAQNSSFIQDDNFDFQAVHELWAYSDPDNFTLSITSDSDFPLFKLHIKKEKLNLFDSDPWYATQYKVHIDGNVIQDWTSANEKTISYQFPNPPNGISANHTYNIQVKYIDMSGDDLPTKSNDVLITIFTKPRVFKDFYNNSFIQLRDENASTKIPVLLVEGFDPVNEKFQELYYNLTWSLVNTDLIPNGYEVFILNFIDGGRDLRQNADILLMAIEKVHEICPNYNIAVAGLSMGGPITRYALAKKEQYGTHNVGLFLSYDSPQQGAYVSPGLQDWIKIQDSDEEAIGVMQDNLNSVAAKQMLLYNTYDPNHIFFNDFYDELNSLNGDGYPHQSYNVSFSNGNLDATWGYESEGRHLLTLKINENLIHDVSAVKLDCGTGSKITDITMKRYGDIFPGPFFVVYYEMEIIFNPAYITTYSGLDLVNPVINQITGDITSFDHSKFDDFVVQETPLQHHELSTLTRSTIMEWLALDFDIDVDYTLLEGGTASPDNYQVNILHGLPVTVQPQTVNLMGRQITYDFSRWEDGNSDNPRTFYTSHDVSHTATMKGLQVTTTPFSYSRSSQRGFIKTENGYLHNVYESLGDIYYERSTDNGAVMLKHNTTE